MKALQNSLDDRARHYRYAIDRLLSHVENDPEAYDAAQSLREAVELVFCLRRLLAGRTTAEVHAAFGAPGDFGYETVIGAALARVYSVGPALDPTTDEDGE